VRANKTINVPSATGAANGGDMNNNMETTTYLIVYSDELITSVNRASLNDAEFQKMLVFRNKLKQTGCSLMVVEEDMHAVDGQEALKYVEGLTALRYKAVAVN
jgi:hypothetical protein